MTFENQVKEAKLQKLGDRVFRDVLFLLLGLTFLGISMFSAFKKDKEKKETTTTTTTKVTIEKN